MLVGDEPVLVVVVERLEAVPAGVHVAHEEGQARVAVEVVQRLGRRLRVRPADLRGDFEVNYLFWVVFPGRDAL